MVWWVLLAKPWKCLFKIFLERLLMGLLHFTSEKRGKHFRWSLPGKPSPMNVSDWRVSKFAEMGIDASGIFPSNGFQVRNTQNLARRKWQMALGEFFLGWFERGGFDSLPNFKGTFARELYGSQGFDCPGNEHSSACELILRSSWRLFFELGNDFLIDHWVVLKRL